MSCFFLSQVNYFHHLGALKIEQFSAETAAAASTKINIKRRFSSRDSRSELVGDLTHRMVASMIRTVAATESVPF